MKNTILLFATAAALFACQEKEDTATTTTADDKPQEEITDPKLTEVWEPVPAKVNINNKGVPSDAIVLFDGTNLDQWENAYEPGKPANWIINEDGSMTVRDKSGNIATKQNFGSMQLHIEWSNPAEPRGNDQARGNSGVFFQKLYEVQVLDNYDNPTYVNGMVSSVYKQHIPLVNASNPSGEWQTYDIIFHEPKFNAAGEKIKSGTFTVLFNGVLVQDHVEIFGTSEYIGPPKNPAHGKGPLMLQDHQDNSGVKYRNIWVRELND